MTILSPIRSDKTAILSPIRSDKAQPFFLSRADIQLRNQDVLLAIAEQAENSIDLTIAAPPKDGDSFDWDDFILLAASLHSITKKGGVVAWIVSDKTLSNGSESGVSFRQALHFMLLGFSLHDTMIYEKSTPAFPSKPNANRYTNCYQYMFILSKGEKPKTANLLCDKPNKFGGKQNFNDFEKTIPEFSARTNIWKYSSILGRDAACKPALPLGLTADLIATWSVESDTVYDPFMRGGASVGCAAVEAGRKFIGIESDEACFIDAEAHIADAYARYYDAHKQTSLAFEDA
jgi:site-specific DNA-methyltransferase (adenine-specific)